MLAYTDSTAFAAYAAYLCWLIAGFADFRIHRRTAIAHTSGLAESRLHLLQLALIGGGVLLWLACEPSRTLLWISAGLVVAHAVVAWRDTSTAWGRREIGPLEQHVHSVLDAAAPVALAILAGMNLQAPHGFALREPALRPGVWAMWLAPALLLVLLPALLEFRTCLAASRVSRS
ncbi:hypothetical protein [Arenimonas composti]|uniref:Transmembrane protein n=1 Tax=Arenimonas composti TR7-09 = DSM 18010 TaxID=1121013 RepID=A0A091BFI2_9GAMM|nr:hypothetical protein [Arenimonas composti]KFN50476.1 hypothetical protein P873_07375 [Arenimonas composti TR7-09 = DSM 18010]